MIDQYAKEGYTAHSFRVDTKHYYIPHTRTRVYLIAVDSRAAGAKLAAEQVRVRNPNPNPNPNPHPNPNPNPSPNQVQGLAALQTLDIKENDVPTLPPQLSQLGRLTALGISGNPIRTVSHSVQQAGTAAVLALLAKRMPL